MERCKSEKNNYNMKKHDDDDDEGRKNPSIVCAYVKDRQITVVDWVNRKRKKKKLSQVWHM